MLELLGRRDARDAAADGCLGSFLHDLISGYGDGLQSGGAEAIDGDARDGDRQTGADQRDAGNIVSLRAVGVGTAEDDVVDFPGVELRRLAEDVLNAVSGQIVGASEIE